MGTNKKSSVLKEVKKSMKFKMHVISGTHWDREWRYTAEQSKLRLTNLIDNLLDILEKKPEYKFFHLDGGTIILEDYLSVRPENKERIKKLIKEKRIFLVNWYTLPDMFIVNPEALIRNLLIGQNIGKEFGGGMKTGYTATSYGQISQLPQIYRNFGIDSVFFYRGLNKHVVPPCFLWKGLDDSQLFGIRGFDIVTRTNWFFFVHQPLVLNKLPRDLSYAFEPRHLPVHLADEESYELDFQVLKEDIKFANDNKSLKNALNLILQQLEKQNIGEHLLALNMEDNQKPYELLPEMIDALNKVTNNVEIQQDNWDDFVEKVKKDTKLQSLETYSGEFRHTAVEEGFNGLLGAVLSSRVNLKILNEKAETTLIYLAEPIASIATSLGWEYPKNILHLAWKSLLQNHAHDSICGAAVDQAHKDMLYRFSHTQTVADEITRRGLEKIWQNINFSCFEKNDFILTLFNTLPYTRKEVIMAIVDIPENLKVKYFDLIDIKGKKIEYVILSRREINMRVERELDTSVKFKATRYKIIFESEVPQMGYVSYALRPRGPEYAPQPQHIELDFIGSPEGVLENEYLKVSLNSNGTFNVIDKTVNKTYKNLHYFIDNGEVGNAHFTIAPENDFVVTSLGNKAKITLVENNNLRAIFKVELSMEVPKEATIDGKERLKETVEIPITYWITLERNSKRVQIKTKIINIAKDHKLRVVFPTGIKTDYAFSESAFAVEKRNILWKNTKDNFEKHFPYQPMQNFVDITDGNVGIAFLSKGLREYEVFNDKQRNLAITLIRTHRAYMTANENMTYDELERYSGSHVLGEIQFKYALYFHQFDTFKGEVIKEAYCHKVPVKIVQGCRNAGDLPPEFSFIQISPEKEICFSALKIAENNTGMVLRLWNPLDEKIKTKITFGLPPREIKICKLNEEEIEGIKPKNNVFELEIKKHKILTLLIKYDKFKSVLP